MSWWRAFFSPGFLAVFLPLVFLAAPGFFLVAFFFAGPFFFCRAAPRAHVSSSYYAVPALPDTLHRACQAGGAPPQPRA